MKTLRAILSKGKDDFGAWFENLEGVYGGIKRPRPNQLKKIETAFRQLGQQLIAVEL